MAIDTTKKIKQVTYNGTEIPLRGYDTSDATVTAVDMLEGVIGYGASGKVMGTARKKVTLTASQGTVTVTKNGQHVMIHGKYTPPPPEGRAFIVDSATIAALAPVSDFGDATAADVAKGKTFTSAAGLKVTGTAAGSSAADVTFELYNNDFNNLAVVYMSKTDGVMQTTIPISDHMPITTSEGSMVVMVNQAFDGDTIDLVPDNGVHIAQGWRTKNVTMFVAGAETNGMNIDVNAV